MIRFNLDPLSLLVAVVLASALGAWLIEPAFTFSRRAIAIPLILFAVFWLHEVVCATRRGLARRRRNRRVRARNPIADPPKKPRAPVVGIITPRSSARVNGHDGPQDAA